MIEAIALPPRAGAVRVDEALRYAGYAGIEATPAVRERARALAEAAEQVECAHGAFRMFSMGDADEGDVRVPGAHLTLPGQSIADYLDGACAVCLLAVTMGAAADERLRAFGDASRVDGVLYGAVLADLVEDAANQLEARVRQEAFERGWYANDRYSTGYGDLPLSVHPAFLAALDAEAALGMRTVDGGFLAPSRSITAVVGLFADPPARAKLGCAWCAARPCCTIRAAGCVCYRRDR
jgi:hypothetical protein